MKRSGLVAALALAVAACGEKAQEITMVERWQVSAEPAVAIGVAEGEAPYELHRASGALRTSDGRIVVANSGSAELRIFDSAGAYLRTIGRRGSGPGEYRGTLSVYPLDGDSLVVHDGGNERFTVLDPDGSYVRVLEVAREPFPWDDWLHEGAWVSGVRNPSLRPCVAAALAMVPAPAVKPVALRRVLVDEAGRLWIRPLVSAEYRGTWRVYSMAGEPLGEVALPDGFRPFQVGEDFVLGNRTGADGGEQIQLYRIAGPATAGASAPACTLPPMEAERVPVPNLMADLRNAVVAQEMHYADHRGYAAHADSLGWASETGGILTVVARSESGWAGILATLDGGPICAISVGDVTPAGWPEGAPQCAATGG